MENKLKLNQVKLNKTNKISKMEKFQSYEDSMNELKEKLKKQKAIPRTKILGKKRSKSYKKKHESSYY